RLPLSAARTRSASRRPRTDASPEPARCKVSPPARSTEKLASRSFFALTGLVNDALGKIIRHLGLVTGDVIVSRLQQLVLAIQQLLADGLLHARIGQLALAARLLREHLQD